MMLDFFFKKNNFIWVRQNGLGLKPSADEHLTCPGLYKDFLLSRA